MRKSHILFYSISIILLSTIILSAQDTPKFKYRIGGTVQAWTSMGEINGADTNSIGWGLRRVRLRAYSSFGDKMKGYIQFELTSGKLTDARIEYLISKSFTLRAGRFIGASIRGGGLTSHTKIDIVERPTTAVQWAKHTVGSDYRDYGVDGVFKFGDIKASITLHNGDGKSNIVNKQTKVSKKNGSFAISGMASFKPKSIKGLEVGGYYGMGNPELNEYTAYNAYVYYEPKPLRIKAEIIGWTNKRKEYDRSQMGFYLFTGYRFAKNWEVVARVENYDPNTDLDDNQKLLLTGGLTYSLFSSKWTAGKISMAYTIQQESDKGYFPEIDNNVFKLMMQLVF